jgi:hypothetical protein
MRCELINTCGFFINFGKNSETLKQGWLRNFCENQERSLLCKRRLIREKTGKPPVDNMTPMGKIL